jgi:TolB-like protein
MSGSSESGNRPRSFLGELKRRHVFRVLAVYVAVALGVLQVASLTFGPLHLPSWTLTFVVVLALLGLPVAAVIAWAFETSPDGIRPTAGGARGSWVHAAALLLAAVGLTVGAGFGARAWLGEAALPFLGGRAGAGAATDSSAAEASHPLASASNETTIAILPLENLSPDPHDAYLAGVMTDELTTALATVPGLEVVSQRSAAKLAGSDATVPEIADSLGVRYVLTGSERRSEGRAAITARLVDGRSDKTVWTERFERPDSDVVRLESDVARRIARSLRSELTREERKQLEAGLTDDPAAYDLFRQAMEMRQRRSGPADSTLLKTIHLLRQAVARDSTFSGAWGRLGELYGSGLPVGGSGWTDSSALAFDRAVRYAKTPGTRMTWRAERASFSGGNPDSTIALLRAAVRQRPNEPELVRTLAGQEHYRGDLVAAARWGLRARDLDPLNGGAWAFLADCYREVGLYDEAERAVSEVLALDRSNPTAWRELQNIDISRGLYGAALGVEDSLVRLGAGVRRDLDIRAAIYLSMGKPARARDLLERAYRTQPWRSFLPYAADLILARQAVGDTAGNGELLERSLRSVSRIRSIGQRYFREWLLWELAGVQGDAAGAARHLRTYNERGGYGFYGMLADPTLGPVRSDSAVQAVTEQWRARVEGQRRQVRALLAEHERRAG